MVLRVALVAGIAALVLGVGAVNGVGPLARVTPPSAVTDPDEMLARALQATIDTSAVHVTTTLLGHVPGSVLGRSEASTSLDGTEILLWLRPQDARSRMAITSPSLGVDIDAVSFFDTLAVRSGGGAWVRVSMGSLVGSSGVDANPLTLVGRVRAWLAQPGAPVPALTDVACDAPSGRCHEVRLVIPATGGETLGRLIPGLGSSGASMTTTLVADLDVKTLRPARVVALVESPDETVSVRATSIFRRWDGPIVIPDPGSG